MINSKNNAALQSYMSFRSYRAMEDELKKTNSVSSPSRAKKSKGLMSFTNGMKEQKKKTTESETEKGLKAVLHYVKMIEGMGNGA